MISINDSPRLLVAELFAHHFSQLQPETVRDLLRQILVRAAAEDLDVRHVSVSSARIRESARGGGMFAREPKTENGESCRYLLSDVDFTGKVRVATTFPP